MFTFRTATTADIDRLLSLIALAYRGDGEAADGWTTESHLVAGSRITEDVLRVDLENAEGRILVASDSIDGPVVACCNVLRKAPGRGYFGMFAVDPSRQGTGLGKAVLAEAERVVGDEWGLETLEMTVLEQRPELIAYYERRGFVRTGAFEPFPYGDDRFGRPLRDDLRFVVLRKALGA